MKINITALGGIEMLHDDSFNLKEFGDIKMKRASHVEFNEKKQKWFVQSALTNIILKDDFDTRKDALTWEKEHYSPGGKGWNEIK